MRFLHWLFDDLFKMTYLGILVAFGFVLWILSLEQKPEKPTRKPDPTSTP